MESESEHGTRDYIQILRLLEKYSLKEVTTAVEKALRHRVHTADAIEQFLPDCPDWRHTCFTLAGHQHLRWVKVSVSNLADYTDLLHPGGAA